MKRTKRCTPEYLTLVSDLYRQPERVKQMTEPKPTPTKQDAKQALERVMTVSMAIQDPDHQQRLGMVSAFLMALIATNEWEP